MMPPLAPLLAAFGPIGLPELIILGIMLAFLVGLVLLILFIIKKLSGKK